MKYFILAEDCTLGIKYNSNKGIMSMGGYKRFSHVLEHIFMYLFDIENFVEYEHYPQRNKLRYDIKMDMEKYNEYIRKFQDSDYILQQTETLYRIMR